APRSPRRFAAQRENAAGPSGGLRREHVFYGAARNRAALAPAAQRERISAENSGAAPTGNQVALSIQHSAFSTQLLAKLERPGGIEFRRDAACGVLDAASRVSSMANRPPRTAKRE